MDVATLPSKQRIAETTARLHITSDGVEATLVPISNKDDCNLILEGKGNGQVLVDGSPVLTVDALANVDQLAQVLAGLTIVGLDNAAVQAMIDAALAALPPGTDVAAVQALIDTAIAAIPDKVQPLLDVLSVSAAGAGTVSGVQAMWQAVSDANTALYTLINNLAGKPTGGGTVNDVLPALQAAMTAIAQSVVSQPLNGPLLVANSFTAGMAGDAEVIAYSPDNKPVNLDLQAPGGAVKANGQPILNELEIRNAVMEWLKIGVFLGSPRITDARVGSFFSAGGEGRIVTFEHVDGSTWLRVRNGANGPEIGVEHHPLAGVSSSDIRIRPQGLGALVIGTASPTATVKAGGDLNDVDLSLEAQGAGKVKIGDSRVLTELDLGQLGGGGILDGGTPFDDDSAPTAAAGSIDIQEILKVLMGGTLIPDQDWQVCPISGPSPNGKLEIRMLNGWATLKGEITMTNAISPADGWVKVRDLPTDFPLPAAGRISGVVMAFLSGTGWTQAAYRISSNGIEVSTMDQQARLFNFNGITYQGF